MRITKIILVIFLLGGLTVLGVTVWQVRFADLWHVLRAMGPWLLPFLLLETVPTVLHAAGWAACFPGPQRPLAFWQLWLVRLSGSAINQTTPTATVGGEVVRVLLLEAVLPRAQAIAPVVIGKAAVTIAQMMYLAGGTLYVMHRLALPANLQVGVSLMIGLTSLGLGGFVACQRYGALSHLVRGLERLSLPPQWLPRLSQALRTLDTHLGAYYTEHPWRFVRALGFHGLGFAYAGVKTYILLRLLLGEEAPGFVAAWTVAIVVDALDQLFFFVPGRLGTLEGIRFTVLSTLGVAHVYGLAFGLIARLEHLVWSGLGLLAYGLCTRKPTLLSSSPLRPLFCAENPRKKRCKMRRG